MSRSIGVGRAAAGRPFLDSRSRRLSLWLVAALILLVGGPLAYRAATGGGTDVRPVSKPQYELLVQGTYAKVQGAFRGTNVPVPLLAERIARAQDALRNAAEVLASVEPPPAIRGENLALSSGLRDYADDLDSLREAVSTGDTAELVAFRKAIRRQPAIAKIAEAAEEMKFKGYQLGPIAAD